MSCSSVGRAVQSCECFHPSAEPLAAFVGLSAHASPRNKGPPPQPLPAALERSQHAACLAFLQTRAARTAFSLVSCNLTISPTFTIYFPSSLLTLKPHFKIFPCVTPTPLPVTDLAQTPKAASSLGGQLAPSDHPSPQELTTRELASNVDANLDPAGDSLSMRMVTMSPQDT